MKLLNLIIFSVIFSSCGAQTNFENMTITYEAATRGSSISLIATSTKINYKDFEAHKEIVLTTGFWNEIIEISKKINLSNIHNFSPPTDNRTVDAALHATLSIHIDHTIYKSQTFDHGNPPKELKPLVDKLFSILKKE